MVKCTYLQHIPHRQLPVDFAPRFPESVVTTPNFGVAEPRLMHADIRAALDEAMHTARAGFDAVALTEHGQSSHDMNPNPDLGAAALAHQIGAEDLDTGLHVVGRSLRKTCEPLRVAEELAWLDNLSNGRLMADTDAEAERLYPEHPSPHPAAPSRVARQRPGRRSSGCAAQLRPARRRRGHRGRKCGNRS